MSFLNIAPVSRDDIDHLPRVDADVSVAVQGLEQAAARYALRRDNFAFGKSATCLDIAAKLQRFGSFASDKQREFAQKLVEWSLPRVAAAAPTAAAAITYPRLHALMARHAVFQVEDLEVRRKNGDTLCWIKVPGVERPIGRLTDGGECVLWQRGQRVDLDAVHAALARLEADPEGEAGTYGRLSGRCAMCARDLTDPESIARGIGPICASRGF